MSLTVPSSRPIAVLDLDGVLADVRHRLRFVEKTPKDWDAFFAAISADPPLEVGLALVARLFGRPWWDSHDTVAARVRSGRPVR